MCLSWLTRAQGHPKWSDECDDLTVLIYLEITLRSLREKLAGEVTQCEGAG